MKSSSDLDEYLTDEGRAFLARWGIRLAALGDGSVNPIGPNEKHFVETFRNSLAPSGKSAVFWFNVRAIGMLIEKCAALELAVDNAQGVKRGLVKRINNQEREIEKRVRPLEKEIEELKKSLQACWTSIDQYESQLGISKPNAATRTGGTCPICKGTGGMGNCSRCDGKGYL